MKIGLNNLLYKAYAIDVSAWRRAIRFLIKQMDGGQYYSITLRRIFFDYHQIEIGMYSYGGCFKLGHIPPGTRIGRYGSFSEFRIFGRNHPLDFISTHPFFYNSALGIVPEDTIPYTPLVIGHDVWIGYGAIILPRVEIIGNGSVIAAGAVVSKNVPAYAVVAGNPAKVIRYRFSPDVIEYLEQFAWWDLDIDVLCRKLDIFTKPLDLENLLHGEKGLTRNKNDYAILR